ncbi:transposase family protein [Domibacillus sp. A3M-37]|uniref:transposase family protein n=1 Tax=Domibacillus sp. A3M-37 TaxID=2962037 RepID=UPI0020B8EE83|nr:transposase family protein [Domibacillus sp. A3M-37]MCP3763772.1 transposase family protein [Domibacillus sp. A3M-37]
MLSISWPSPDLDLELLHVTSTDDSLFLAVKRSSTSVSCPGCSTLSHRKYSQYSRKVQDLSIGSKSVILLLITRKWFCEELECPLKIFTERYNWLSPNGRRTARAEEVLRKLAFSTSCLSAEKVAKSIHLPVSHDTLLNLVRQTQIEPEVYPFCRDR